MEKINLLEGFRESLDFLEDLMNFHLIWKRVSDQGLD
jgi:hypothetical protein